MLVAVAVTSLFALARRAPEGAAVGIDVDETKIDLAHVEAADAGVDNVEFRLQDVMDSAADGEGSTWCTRGRVDPSARSSQGVDQHASATGTTGGVLVVEDIDCTGHFCEPYSSAFWRYVELYTQAVQSRGCDPNIGPLAPVATGGRARTARCERRTASGDLGRGELISPLTLEAIADAVLAVDLADPDELAEVVDELYRFAEEDETFLSIPRMVQAWGYNPKTSDAKVWN